MDTPFNMLVLGNSVPEKASWLQSQRAYFFENGIVEDVEPIASEADQDQVCTLEDTRKTPKQKKSGKAIATVLRQMPMREAKKKERAALKKLMEWSPANERARAARYDPDQWERGYDPYP
ncbi:hypothetical protein K7X08_027038 [Anisodus acutangulus]|uniref:Uncharacterized protein n=1 Tax=Anisodus acutangulus TaxID=402998 RepID=A0A9Q1L9K8_9SOLA|nr:hypothetical protein K7X08_027038 [Anisodus acutangulus]